MQAPNHIEFLLYLDDDADDRELFHDTFREIEKDLELVLLSEGEQALDLLLHAKRTGNIPKLIILDLNMPGVDGRMVLTRIREDNILSTLPVVIFTTSSNDVDKAFAIRNNAEFFTKPSTVPGLKSIIENIVAVAKVGKPSSSQSEPAAQTPIN